MKINSYFIFAASLAVVFQFFPFPVQAASYDIYVDSQSEGERDGSENNPHISISDAIQQALSSEKHKRKISVKKGVYEEDLMVGQSVTVNGDGRGRTVIAGKVFMEDGSILKNITIDTGENTGIAVEDGDADIVISSVEIRGTRKIGINIFPGKGKLTFENLVIHKGRGKGMYIQRGHEIELVNSKIYDNAEEGVDIRDSVTGKIRNNSIYENGEGGMELILGDSVLDIRGNNIFKNKASGISTQFYSIAKSLGKVNIQENKINNNGKYGIDCGIPSGGNPIAGYWAKSINLSLNTIEKNGREEINQFCRIIRAVDSFEESDNNIKETTPDKGAIIMPPEEAPLAVTLTEEDLSKERAVWDQVELLARIDEAGEKKANLLIKKIQGQGFFQRFFLGAPASDLDVIREEIERARENIKLLEILLEQAKNVQSDTSIQDFIAEERGEIKSWEDFIQMQERRWNFKKWLGL